MRYIILGLSFLVTYFAMISGGSEEYLFSHWFHELIGWDAVSIHQKCEAFWSNDTLLKKCYSDLSTSMSYFYRVLYLSGYLLMLYLAYSGNNYMKFSALFFVAFLGICHFSFSGFTSVVFIGNAAATLILVVLITKK